MSNLGPLVPPTPPARSGRPPLPHAPRPPVPSTTAGKEEPMKGLGVNMRPPVQAKEHDDTPPAQPRRSATAYEDSGNQKVQALIDQAVASLRHEFMQALDKEREEVARLQAEVEELRQRLDM
jgi:molecular chaperone GrpE (heat shock protein)